MGFVVFLGDGYRPVVRTKWSTLRMSSSHFFEGRLKTIGVLATLKPWNICVLCNNKFFSRVTPYSKEYFLTQK